MPQRHKIAFEALHEVIAVAAYHHDFLGWQGVEAHRDFRDKCQGSLASCKQLAEVDGLLTS